MKEIHIVMIKVPGHKWMPLIEGTKEECESYVSLMRVVKDGIEVAILDKPTKDDGTSHNQKMTEQATIKR